MNVDRIDALAACGALLLAIGLYLLAPPLVVVFIGAGCLGIALWRHR